MKRHDDYHPQVPATQPNDGFLFEPVAVDARDQEAPVSREGDRASANASLPYKEVK